MLMKKVFYKNTCSVGTHLYLIAITLLFLVVCLTSCAPTAGLFAGGKWQSGGLQHQHIRSLAVDPNNPQIIYAGDAQDGVFVSTNEGSSWAAVNNGLPSGIIMHNLVFDSVQHQLWAATNQGIYRSGGAGKLWQVLNNGLPSKVDVNIILPAAINGGDKGLVFAGTNQGFFRSQDDGSQWSPSQESLSGLR